MRKIIATALIIVTTFLLCFGASSSEFGTAQQNSGNVAKASAGAEQLLYSTPYGVWLDEYESYNSYAFVLGITRPYDSFYLEHEPGDFNEATENDYDPEMSVSEMATLTKSDLQSLGYPCITVTTNYNVAMALADTHTVICLRKSNENLGFHYMKYYNGMWLHKPQKSHVLILNGKPNEVIWNNEKLIDGEYVVADREYTSTIYYFAYRTTHDLVSQGRTGVNYHDNGYHYFECIGRCSHCGATENYWERVTCSGPPCAVWMNLEETD